MKKEKRIVRNIRMILQYDGTRYNGWQKQKNTKDTIQGKLEILLSKLLDETIVINGSGRTDAGVHARGQVANFHTASCLPLKELERQINLYLPEDIAVLHLTEMPERFHARLNATRKTYQYTIWNASKADVFQRNYVHCEESAIDVRKMQEAAKYLLGEHDFTSFCSKNKNVKSKTRNIEEVEIQKEGNTLKIIYRGNGFLYNMVRILTGTLLEVGTGKRMPQDIQRILDARDRAQAGPMLEAKGLTLLSVEYR